MQAAQQRTVCAVELQQVGHAVAQPQCSIATDGEIHIERLHFLRIRILLATHGIADQTVLQRAVRRIIYGQL